MIKSHLADDGKFAVLLPYHRKNEFVQIAIDAGFFPGELISVKQTPKHTYFRVMLLFSAVESDFAAKEIVIREGDEYTNAFTALLKDYYLKL